MTAGRGWLIVLTGLSLVAAGAAVVGLGLSAMAADDLSRLPQARRLQGLVLVWLLVSLGAPVATWRAWGRHGAMALWWFLPAALVGLAATAGLIGF